MSVYESAAFTGKMDVLQWVWMQPDKPALGPKVCTAAAMGGQLECKASLASLPSREGLHHQHFSTFHNHFSLSVALLKLPLSQPLSLTLFFLSFILSFRFEVGEGERVSVGRFHLCGCDLRQPLGCTGVGQRRRMPDRPRNPQCCVRRPPPPSLSLSCLGNR